MLELPWQNGDGLIAERVAGRVAREIAEGDIEPGEVLTEVAIAARTGVSRTPVREAMLQLDRWGLVRLAPKKGAVVTSPTARDQAELLAVRAMLETSAARSTAAADVSRGALVSALRENLAEQRAAVGESRTFATLDFVFHSLVIGHDDNRVVAEISRTLGPRLYRLTRLAVSARSQDLAGLLDEHVALTDALDDGDPERYARLVAQHIDQGHASYEVTE
ncbi:Transcriptional regulator, GntR family [Actinomycetales bacterium JB111]|nr:Transcriptional regulator, GntR family [Actinomycetales bacterium JB111]